MFTGTQVVENLDAIVRYLEALPDSELLPPLGKSPLVISKGGERTAGAAHLN